MPIQTTCPSCQRPLRVPDELIGQAVRCPACATAWTVEQPAAEGSAEPSSAPTPPGDPPDDGIRETPKSPESRLAADEHVRETPGGAGEIPPPPPRSDDDFDDDEDDLDEDDFERGLEGRYGRHRSSRLVKEAKGKLLGPVIGVFIVGGLVLVDSIFRLITGLAGVGMAASMPGPKPASMIAIQGIGAVYGVWLVAQGGLAVFGGIQMLKLKSWGWSLASCILVMIPNCECCFLLGLPFGIWGLVMLCQDNVKLAFQLRPTIKATRPDPDDDPLDDSPPTADH